MNKVVRVLVHIARRTAASCVLTTAVVGLIGLVAGWIRALPWFVSPDIPLHIAVLFLGLIMISTLEVALLVAMPLGTSLSLVRLEVDGTLAAFRCVGGRPVKVLMPLFLVWLVWGAGLFVTSGIAGAIAQRPGNFLRVLLSQSQEMACHRSSPTWVPLVNLSWICIHGKPRAVGTWRGGDVSVGWLAEDVVVEAQVDRLVLSQVEVLAQPPGIAVAVERATISPLVAWRPATQASGTTRALVKSILGLCAAVMVSWMALASRWTSYARAFVLSTLSLGPVLLLGTNLTNAPTPLALAVGLVLTIAAPITPTLALTKADWFRRSKFGKH